MRSLNALDWVALVLLIIGGLNWGLVGLLETDLVAALFGPMTMLSRIVYSLVGLSALYVAVISPSLHRHSEGVARQV